MISFDDRLAHPDPEGKNDRVHFFKYMSEGTAKIVLKNQTLRWATPEYLNDPFELDHRILGKVDNGRVKQEALELLWQVYQGTIESAPGSLIAPFLIALRQQGIDMSRSEFEAKTLPGLAESVDKAEEVVQQVVGSKILAFAQVKILSLTIRPDINLMWSHYANSHKGIVFRFRSIPAQLTLFAMAQPVRYTNEIPAFVTEDFMAKMFAGVPLPTSHDTINAIIFRKSLEWEYEQEWRLSLGFGHDRAAAYEDIRFGDNELDGVIFGTRTSNADKAEIRQLCARYPNIEFMQATQVPGATTLGVNVIP